MTIPIEVVDKGGAASYGGRHQSGLLILVSKRKFVLVSDTQSNLPVVWPIRLIWSRMPWSSGEPDRTSWSGDPSRRRQPVRSQWSSGKDRSFLRKGLIRTTMQFKKQTAHQGFESWCRNRPGRVVSTGDVRKSSQMNAWICGPGVGFSGIDPEVQSKLAVTGFPEPKTRAVNPPLVAKPPVSSGSPRRLRSDYRPRKHLDSEKSTP